jgi:hypothetical protein
MEQSLSQSGALMDLPQGFQVAYLAKFFQINFPGIFTLIQNQYRFESSCQHEKCYKLDLIPPCKFLDF